MTGLFDVFGALDWALIAVISLIAVFVLHRWNALAWTVILALGADFALPGLYYLVTGDGWDNSWGRAASRFVDNPGGVLILRTAIYFALIGALFGIKVAWRKR